jgi:hypothetical protein
VLSLMLGGSANAQWVQTNGLRDRQITHIPTGGTNVPQEISREFLGERSKHRLHSDFVTGIDSHRMKGSSYPFPNDRFISIGFPRGTNPALAKLSFHSHFNVIDTAIVRHDEAPVFFRIQRTVPIFQCYT